MTTLARTRPIIGQLGRLDPVLLAAAAILLAIFIGAPDQGRASVAFTLDSLWGIAPYLVASIALAAGAKAAGADGLIAKAFTGRPYVMIFLAAGFGALSPFCSCGVIPLIAALLAMGVPLGPVMAFWLASPVIDPSMFVLTAGMLGLQFAVAKTIAAIAIGLAGGFAIHALTARGYIGAPLREGLGDGGCAGASVRAPKPVKWRFWEDAARRGRFWSDAGANTLFLGKWLALAFLLESLMLAYLPESHMDKTYHQPLGGNEMPRFAGPATMMRLPLVASRRRARCLLRRRAHGHRHVEPLRHAPRAAPDTGRILHAAALQHGHARRPLRQPERRRHRRYRHQHLRPEEVRGDHRGGVR
jgi:uncharacterized protein